MKDAAILFVVCFVVRFDTEDDSALIVRSCIELTDDRWRGDGRLLPEVVENREFIEKVIRTEEERFHETLSDGLAILADISAGAKRMDKALLAGADAFNSI